MNKKKFLMYLYENMDLTPSLRRQADPPTGVTSPARRGEQCLAIFTIGKIFPFSLQEKGVGMSPWILTEASILFQIYVVLFVQL